jgi:hypothetical protein
MSASTPSEPRSHAGEATIVALVLLAAVGVGVTNFSPQYGFHYWMAMAPIFAVVNLATSWSRARAAGQNAGNILLAQGLHWVGAVLAIYMIFLLFRMNWLSDQESGVLALLVLALAAFLSGVHTDWHFCVVGLVLGAIVAAAVLVEEFMWMLVLPLGVAALAAAVWWWTARPPQTPAT